MDKVFKALADQTRRKIIKMLLEKDLSAGDIAKAFNTSQPTISYHLDILKASGLVTVERKGQFIIYSQNVSVASEVLHWTLETLGIINKKRKGEVDE